MNLSIHTNQKYIPSKTAFNAKLIIRKNSMDSKLGEKLIAEFGNITKNEKGNLLIAPAEKNNGVIAGFGNGEYEAFAKFNNDDVFVKNLNQDKNNIMENILNIFKFFKYQESSPKISKNDSVYKTLEQQSKFDKTLDSIEFYTFGKK